MAGPPAPGFGSLAERYDELRPADANWREIADAIWEHAGPAGRRVLDVGCGTGALAVDLASRGARVWGVDSSPEMLAVARERAGQGVGLKQAAAERLPFQDAWFDAAVMRTVVHLVDRPRALPELGRVLAPGGTAVIATFAHEHFDRIWVSRMFPSLRALDLGRFPDPVELAAELERVGLRGVAVRRISQSARIPRAQALEKLRGRYISTLSLLPEDEYLAGLQRAERELPGTVESGNEWAIVTGVRPTT